MIGTRLVLVALLASAADGRAQAPPLPTTARPEVFYILQQLPPPPVDPARLPPDAREPYERVRALERTFRTAAETLPRGEIRNRRLDRLGEEADHAWARLRVALAAHPGALDGAGWRLYGDALHHHAAVDFLEQYEAAADDPDARLPDHPDFEDAITVFRHAAAVSTPPEDAGWARYREAICLLEMGRERAAEAAFRATASRGAPSEVAAEARLRLGELAFDGGDLREAAGWYARSLDGLRADLRPVALYKLAWARWLDGRPQAAREAVEALPRDAPPEMREELLELVTRRP